MGVIDKIAECIVNNGMQDASLVVDGQYLEYSGRKVYVKVLDSNGVLFFTRVYQASTKSLDIVEIGDQRPYLEMRMQGNRIFDVTVSAGLKGVAPKVYADAGHKIVFMESPLYQVGCEVQKDTGRNWTVAAGDGGLGTEEVNIVRTVFLQKSLENYRELVYLGRANRLVKSLFRVNKLYSITPTSFVPVFINYSKVYNPLNSKALSVQDTAMYKMAVGRGRFVENGPVSAYFLTHREICEAFGMTRFARFTPFVWYNLFVGLLQPSNPAFPNKVTKVIRWDSETQPPEGMKRSYGPEEFNKAIRQIPGLLKEEIEQFRVVDSLEDFIVKERNSIKVIGPYYIDDKKNLLPGSLYSLYAEAELLF